MQLAAAQVGCCLAKAATITIMLEGKTSPTTIRTKLFGRDKGNLQNVMIMANFRCSLWTVSIALFTSYISVCGPT